MKDLNDLIRYQEELYGRYKRVQDMEGAGRVEEILTYLRIFREFHNTFGIGSKDTSGMSVRVKDLIGRLTKYDGYTKYVPALQTVLEALETSKS